LLYLLFLRRSCPKSPQQLEAIAMKRVGIYLRVSTDTQTTDNQRLAARSGWEVVGIYEDAGISGARGREKRPGFDRLLKDATARKVNMIAAWSVDRLGRSLQDLVSFLNELQALQSVPSTTGAGHHHPLRARHVPDVR
jgi:predicted site-specific integrase-resolvase